MAASEKAYAIPDAAHAVWAADAAKAANSSNVWANSRGRDGA